MTTTQTPTTSATLERIRERGYWRIVIHPRRFDAALFPDIAALSPFVMQHTVGIAGWNFPHTGANSAFRTGIDWIDYASEWQHYREYWRLYQSGQFVDYHAFEDDWADLSNLWPAPVGWQVGRYLEVTRVIGMLTAVFEFAARLALTDAYSVDNAMHVAILLRRLQGRRLYFANPARMLPKEYIAEIDELPLPYDLPRETIIADTRKLAVRAAREVFLRFGADLPEVVLSGIQAEIAR